MRKLLSGINKFFVVLLSLVLLFGWSGSYAQKALPAKKSVTKKMPVKSKHHHKHHKKRKKKGVEITHHSEDDKKLREIKEAKDRQKSGK